MDQMILHTLSPEELREIISREIRDAIKELPKQSTPPAEILLTRKEAADKLNISLVTLNDWTKRGLIPSYTIGGRVLYKDSEIIDALHKTEKVKY